MPKHYRICVDKTSFSNKPDSMASRAISIRLAKQVELVTLRRLANMLGQGFTWCASTFANGYRLADNFQELQLIAVDIDKDNRQYAELELTWQELELIPVIVHESFSSSEEHRKWRLIYALDEPVTNISDALRLTRLFAKLFGGDTSIVDTARMLYGTNKRVSLLHDDTCSTEDLLDMAFDMGIPAKLSHKRPAEYELANLANCSKAESLTEQMRELAMLPACKRKYVSMVLTDCRDAISQPKELYGSRYRALFMSAMKLAQVPYLSDMAIRIWLKEGLSTNDVWLDWDKDPSYSIDAGIAWGRQHLRTDFLSGHIASHNS